MGFSFFKTISSFFSSLLYGAQSYTAGGSGFWGYRDCWYDTPGKTYAIGAGDHISANAGDDTFVVSAFAGNASVHGNKGSDTLDLKGLVYGSYDLVISGEDYKGKSGTVILKDANGVTTGTLCFSGIDTITEPDPVVIPDGEDNEPPIVPDGYVSGTDGDDLIDLNYIDADGDRIDAGDVIIGGNPGPDFDLVLAGAGNDTVYAFEGIDRVRGGTGDDLLFGGNDGDALFGEEGYDELHGDAGNDTLYGGSEDDTLYGHDGVDRLYGGDGNDTLFGGDGDDVLYGDEANNQYGGTAGADVFVFDSTDGNDKIWDFVRGLDVIRLEGDAGLTPVITHNETNSFVAWGDTSIIVYNTTELDFSDLVY